MPSDCVAALPPAEAPQLPQPLQRSCWQPPQNTNTHTCAHTPADMPAQQVVNVHDYIEYGLGKVRPPKQKGREICAVLWRAWCVSLGRCSATPTLAGLLSKKSLHSLTSGVL